MGKILYSPRLSRIEGIFHSGGVISVWVPRNNSLSYLNFGLELCVLELKGDKGIIKYIVILWFCTILHDMIRN